MSYRVLGLDPTASTCPCPCCGPFTGWWRTAALLPDQSRRRSQPRRRPGGVPQAGRRALRRRHGVHKVGKGRSTRARAFRTSCGAEGEAGLRLHEAGERHAHPVCSSQARGRRYLLPGQPGDRDERGCDLPRVGQGARTLACRDRLDGPRILQDCRGRPHDGSPAPRAVGHRVCRVPQAGTTATSRTLPEGRRRCSPRRAAHGT
jgi:hypothetical protein